MSKSDEALLARVTKFWVTLNEHLGRFGVLGLGFRVFAGFFSVLDGRVEAVGP